MPSRTSQYRFKIDAYSPDTIPMKRLAEYMYHLGNLLGEPDKVHFVEVDGGSTVVVTGIEEEAVPKVEERVRRVRQGDGPKMAMDAFQALNRQLREDNGKAVLLNGHEHEAELLVFLGREIEPPLTFGAFNQEGSIDGVVIMIGGRKDPVPVHVEEEEIMRNCYATRSIAKQLANHIFTDHLRFFGTGRWYRDENEVWVLERFTISTFQVLNDAPLSTVVNSLRTVEGSEWKTLKDPWAELYRIRNEGNSNV